MKSVNTPVKLVMDMNHTAKVVKLLNLDCLKKIVDARKAIMKLVQNVQNVILIVKNAKTMLKNVQTVKMDGL